MIEFYILPACVAAWLISEWHTAKEEDDQDAMQSLNLQEIS